MLNIIKSQLTDEGETRDDGEATGQGIESTTRADAADSVRNAAASESGTQTAAAAEPPIELDEVFGLLKNRRRRDVLRLMTETTETMRLGELAEQIAARECEKDVSQINSQERKRVYVGLYQCHLPKLADVGVIEYNKPRGTIERGPTFEQINRYLPVEEPPVEPDTENRPLLESLSNIMSTGRQMI